VKFPGPTRPRGIHRGAVAPQAMAALALAIASPCCVPGSAVRASRACWSRGRPPHFRNRGLFVQPPVLQDKAQLVDWFGALDGGSASHEIDPFEVVECGPLRCRVLPCSPSLASTAPGHTALQPWNAPPCDFAAPAVLLHFTMAANTKCLA
jgi:hypothetical protein